MAEVDVTFRMGGEAGQGVETSGAGFAEALTRGGLNVVGVGDYRERIRGGHNFYTIRASTRPIYAIRDKIQVLIALTAETIPIHIDSLSEGGAIIVDEETEFDQSLLQGRDIKLVRLPLGKIAEEEGGRVMTNTAALAVAACITDLPLEHVLSVIQRNFRTKGEKVINANRQVAERACEMSSQRQNGDFRYKVQTRPMPPRLVIEGNQAFSMGAVMGGLKFVSGYPMTPATSVLEYLSLHAKDWGLVVRQGEDEIAVANMVVGASHAGVRALAATSGGGFDLMTEALSLAGMVEDPMVIYLAQRPGPATGLSTRTAQGDLFLAIGAAHGEFPRVVLAPHTPQEHFICGYRALNIAEKYQCLVIVLTDHHNATSVHSCDAADFGFEHVKVERGKLLSPEELDGLQGEYLRYALTDDGISPRAIPGSSPKAVFHSSANEHDERGLITEDAAMSAAQTLKRMRKLEAAKSEMRPPIKLGPEEADITFIGWGSSYGPIRETIELLAERGTRANMVHFVDLWPFPAEAARQALQGARRLIDVEANVMAQFAQLLHAETEINVDQFIARNDGRPITPDYILEHLEGK